MDGASLAGVIMRWPNEPLDRLSNRGVLHGAANHPAHCRDHQKGEEVKFSIQYGVGRVKYVVNYHDGKQTHRDGSSFFDIATFSNKRKMDAFVRGLKSQGYTER